MDKSVAWVSLASECQFDLFLSTSLYSLKIQQGLLVDFASFPQKFIDLLNLCYSEEDSESPR